MKIDKSVVGESHKSDCNISINKSIKFQKN